MKIVDYMKKTVDNILFDLERRTEMIKRQKIALTAIDEKDNLIYKISIMSLWTDENGKHICYKTRVKTSLELAIKRAFLKFRKVNMEQIFISSKKLERINVSVCLPNASRFISLPKKFWIEIAKKYVDK